MLVRTLVIFLLRILNLELSNGWVVGCINCSSLWGSFGFGCGFQVWMGLGIGIGHGSWVSPSIISCGGIEKVDWDDR